MISLPYALDPDKNFYEYGAYQDLVTWITEEDLTEEEFEKIFKPLLVHSLVRHGHLNSKLCSWKQME